MYGYSMNGYGNPYFQQNGAMPDMLSQYKGQYQQPAPMQGQQIQMQMQNQQPMMQNQNMPIQQNQPAKAPKNDFIWVQGEAGAKAYLVAPNATVTLWDSESPTIYIKTADSNGVPSMRVLEFTEKTPNADKSQGNGTTKHECKCGKEFVRLKDFDELKAKYEHLEGIVLELTEKPKTTASKSTKTKGDE